MTMPWPFPNTGPREVYPLPAVPLVKLVALPPSPPPAPLQACGGAR
jgi:hypothetical protein